MSPLEFMQRLAALVPRPRLHLIQYQPAALPECGAGDVKIIAAILERAVIGKILTHLGLDPQPPPRGKAREPGHEFAARVAGAHAGTRPVERSGWRTARGGAARDVSATSWTRVARTPPAAARGLVMALLGYLLDTSICIYIARRRPPEVLAHFARLRPGEVGMSLITFGELRYGAQKSARHEESLAVLQRLTELIPVLTPAIEVGRHYGAIRADLEKAGTPIGNNDLWIAAHARALGVTLVSNDTRAFDRVAGLAVANWAA